MKNIFKKILISTGVVVLGLALIKKSQMMSKPSDMWRYSPTFGAKVSTIDYENHDSDSVEYEYNPRKNTSAISTEEYVKIRRERIKSSK